MKPLAHPLLALLFVCLVAPAFAQDKGKEEEKSTDKNSRTNGLQRITPPRHWDIDDEVIEVNVERAVETAMRSVEVALEKMEINLKPIEINLRHLNIEPMEVHVPSVVIPPIEVNIPPIDITIPPIPSIDVDVNHHFRHRHDWDDDNHRKHKSDKEDHEKTKGL